MEIAILGAGNIGGTLGRAWLQAGHTIVFGVRDVNCPKTMSALERARGAIAADVHLAMHESDVILFSIPWRTVPEIVKGNAADLNRKLIMDATNNFAGPVINNLETFLEVASQDRVYRAFNFPGWEVFADPVINGQRADMFYSGPEGETRKLIHGLIEDVGVNPVWVGENDRIHLVDNMGALWVNMIFQRGWKRRSAFKSLN